MRNYVTINGVDSTSLAGFLIQELPPLSLPKMRTKTETIDGRDGDIITKLGYSAYDKEITIGLYGSYDIDKINEFFVSEGTIVFSNEPDKYYRFTMVDGIDYDRLVRFRTGKITFHCQPYKYDATETEIDYTNTYTEDTVPYIYRASPHDANKMKLKKVVGGTIAWNQKVRNGNFESTTYWSASNGSISANNNELTYTLTTVGTYGYDNQIQENLAENMVSGHKYLLSSDCYGSKALSLTWWLIGGSNSSYKLAYSTANAWGSIATVVNASATHFRTQIAFNASLNSLAVGDTVKLRNVMIFDLTQMVGSTIADYIYSLEQAHAGDGVAWFKALFGEDYYPYNAGELLSVKTSARKTYNADNVEIGSYALDGNLTLRGIPKLDSNNELYYDGDTYASDGSVTRRYGFYKFTGNETQYVQQTNRVAINTGLQMASGSAVCSHFAGAVTGSTRYAYIPTTLTADGLKTFMGNNDVYLVYELATPTTESADAYTQSQRVGASEEFVDGRTVEIPVGNNTLYYDGTPEITVKNKGNTTSRPTLTIYGEGTITVSLNEDEIFTITMGDHEYITIDTEEMNAYMGGVLLNRSVTGDYSSFVLNAGDNTISLSGNVSEVLIDNYSRWL